MNNKLTKILITSLSIGSYCQGREEGGIFVDPRRIERITAWNNALGLNIEERLSEKYKQLWEELKMGYILIMELMETMEHE